MPTRAELVGERPGDRLGQLDVVDRAERERPGTELPRVASSRVTSPPSSSIATTVAADTRSEAVSRCSCSGSSHVAREEHDPTETVVELAEEPVRAQRAPRTRAGCRRVREPFERGAHPLTAPAVRPNAIRRWTSRKKTTTGIAVSVEAAISAAPVGVPARPVEVREPDGDRLVRLVAEQHAREDVLVPGRDEREHRRGDEARARRAAAGSARTRRAGSSRRPSPPPRAPSGSR